MDWARTGCVSGLASRAIRVGPCDRGRGSMFRIFFFFCVFLLLLCIRVIFDLKDLIRHTRVSRVSCLSCLVYFSCLSCHWSFVSPSILPYHPCSSPPSLPLRPSQFSISATYPVFYAHLLSNCVPVSVCISHHGGVVVEDRGERTKASSMESNIAVF